MTPRNSITIRPLALSDIPAALELSSNAGWNQTAADWQRIIALEPHGSFCAVDRDVIVGTTTSVTYGDELAWIGMVLVHQEYRRRGIGNRLMSSALEHLARVGIKSIKLDATPAGRPLYESLGFVAETIVERWEGVATVVNHNKLQELTLERCDSVFSLDRSAFGLDRQRVIERLISESSIQPLMSIGANSQANGYALARGGSAANYVGPLVAENPAVALALLDGMAGAMRGERVYVDFNTLFPMRPEALTDRGFTKQRDLLRMRYGKPAAAGTSPLVFAIAGPELG